MSRVFGLFWTREVALLVFAATIITLIALESIPQSGFVSSELAFADSSKRGFGILPASCPSSPHSGQSCTCNTGTTLLTQTADGKGYTLAAPSATRRISRYNAYFCVFNESSSSYFIPANTQAELDSFRNVSPKPSGVDIWGYTTYSQATYYSQAGYYAQPTYSYSEAGYWGK